MLYAKLDENYNLEKILIQPKNIKIDEHTFIDDLTLLDEEALKSLRIYPVEPAKESPGKTIKSRHYQFDQKKNSVIETLIEKDIDPKLLEEKRVELLNRRMLEELAATDQYVIHSQETGEEIPENIKALRDQIRNKYKNLIEEK